MKKPYFKPEMNVEILLKTDVLLDSFETDNRYEQSKNIFKSDFTVEDIL